MSQNQLKTVDFESKTSISFVEMFAENPNLFDD